MGLLEIVWMLFHFMVQPLKTIWHKGFVSFPGSENLA